MNITILFIQGAEKRDIVFQKLASKLQFSTLCMYEQVDLISSLTDNSFDKSYGSTLNSYWGQINSNMCLYSHQMNLQKN